MASVKRFAKSIEYIEKVINSSSITSDVMEPVLVPRSKLLTKHSAGKDQTLMDNYLDSSSSQVLANELSSLKERSMRFRVIKLIRGTGRWFQYRMVPNRPNERFKNSLSGSRAMRRLSSSSIMTMQAVKLRRMRQGYCHQARLRSLTCQISRMLPMHYRLARHKRLKRQSGTLPHIAQTVLSKRRAF